jgi:two-component system nitrate/nitrite response regulator NarL
VAAIDVRMPGIDGIDVLATLREEGLPTKVVLLSGQISYGDVARGVPGGATSFIDKTADRDTICSTFLAAATGEGHFSPPVQRRLAAVLDPEQRPSALTGRERQILLLTAEGLSVEEVAGRLFVSSSTVKTHLAHIYEKLGVHNKAAAVAIAVRTQVI